MTQQFSTYFADHQVSFLKEFSEFLAFQSISSEHSYKEDILKCADWVVQFLQSIHFQTSLWETSGHPIIFAEDLSAGPDQPTLLIYNHYDVQPVDPLDLWKTPPFRATMHEGQIYARGAQDNKGQCFYVLQALKYYKTVVGALPINIKLIIEGEEECGSHGLLEILPKKAKELKADYLAIVDLGIPNINTPAITLGIRGLVTMDVKLTGSNTDLHSGSHGGLVFNPLHALTDILGKLRDSTGKITVPGFYDSITPISKEEVERLSLTFDEKGYFKEFEAAASGGETAFTPLERNWLRPTLEINGLWGGYTGSGFKTVIPAQAFAKISCRLVPGQDPATIGKLVAKAIESHAPKGIKTEVDIHAGGGPAVRGTPESKIVQAVAKSYEETFKTPCKYILEGASIPVVSKLAETCKAETVLFGLGLPSDKIHAPNEHFGVDRLAKGFEIITRTIQHLRV